MFTSGERMITGQTRTAPLAAEPVRALLRQLLGDLSTLCRQEIALAKADLSGALCVARRSIGVLALGGAIIFAGFLAMLAAAIVGLGALMPMWLAALTVGFTVVILGGALLKVGQSGVGAAKFSPARSKESLRRDKDVLVRSGP
jgi:hypothetical protein